MDRSGSMSGQKMMLMKQTLNLLVTRSGLQAQDKLGIVVFDHDVQILLPLTSMDQAGRLKAKAAIDAVYVGGSTNLSGGLMQGLQLLCQSDEAAREQADDAADGEAAVVVGSKDGGATRSLLLFTDGQANVGITDSGAMVEAAQALLKDHPLAIFTFGYGGDHGGEHAAQPRRGVARPLLLHRQPDAIPAAFADLGGLASVVCQNATLELCVAGGRRATAKIAQLLDMTTYQVRVRVDGSTATLSLGDLYADDEKDVLLRLSLAALAAPRDAPEAVLEAALCYYSVGAKRFERVEAQLMLARPAEPPAGAAPNLKLDEQRNRMEAAEAIEKATALADKGDRKGGEALLVAAAAKLGASASSRTPTSRGLQDDLQRLALDYQDAHTYRTAGSKRSKASALSHRQQRDATSWDTFSATPSDLPYKSGKGGKGAMSRAWTATR